MRPTPRSQTRPFKPPHLSRLTALSALLLALLPGAALAQEVGASSDRNGVILLTSLVVVGSLLLCAVGYLYRRARGMDHPTPDEIEMMGGHGHGDEDHAADSLAVPAHPEAEHGTPAPAVSGTGGHH